jgi:putative nucleotidyltransferase with HDIG domain
MYRLATICDQAADAQSIREHFKGIFEVQCVHAERIFEAEPPGAYTVVGIDLSDVDRIRALKHWLKQKPKDAKLVFITERGSRLDAARAFAVGATDVVHRPIDANTLLNKLWGDFQSLANGSTEFQAAASPAVFAALDALQNVFASMCLQSPIDLAAVDKAGGAVTDQIQFEGLASWIATIRKHHSQTYQHSLLVTGLAVGFGHHLGFSRTDLQRLSLAGLLHDIGKAKVPLSILEKPGALDDEEMNFIKQHPVFGSEALATTAGLSAGMIDVVLHHHEYLDGSGYPHGLMGGEIPDLVRVLTIADIFGALIERRAYKAPWSTEAAYQILLDMGPKLDRDLVREFRSVARVELEAA